MTPHPTRRHLLITALAGAASLPLAAVAQDAKPLEWVLGYPAGGGSDIVARTTWPLSCCASAWRCR